MATRKTNSMPAIAGEDTGAQDTNGFDFDAWLAGATRAQRTVTIYAHNALQADLAALEEERQHILDSAQTAGSWADPDGGDPDTTDVDDRIKKVRADLEASGLRFRLQTLDPDIGDEIDRKYRAPKDADDDERATMLVKQLVAQVAAQIIEPRRFTDAEVEKLRRAIGEPEFMKLVNTAAELRSNQAASDPFSPVSSGNARR